MEMITALFNLTVNALIDYINSALGIFNLDFAIDYKFDLQDIIDMVMGLFGGLGG